MYQLKICLVLLVIIILLLVAIAWYCKRQLDLMMQGKNKPKKMSFDYYNQILRQHFPKAKELYEAMIIDIIGYDGLVSLVNAKILVYKSENYNGYVVYDFY